MKITDELQKLVIQAIYDRKGQDVTIVDMSAIESAATPMFIIAQGSNPRQVAAIADNVREHVQQTGGIKPYNYDGYANSEWIVIDYGHMMVHLFVPEARARYNLEQLWSDALLTDVDETSVE